MIDLIAEEEIERLYYPLDERGSNESKECHLNFRKSEYDDTKVNACKSRVQRRMWR